MSARSIVVSLALLCAAGSARAQQQLPTGFTDVPVVTGLNQPVSLALLPDGRVLFIEQRTARLRLLVHGALAATDPVMTVPGVRSTGNEQGLLGVAVDPRWPASPYVYCYYNWTGSSTIHVARFKLSGDLAGTGTGTLVGDTASRFDILTDIPDVIEFHNGGTLRFGLDGMLRASLGDDRTACGAQDTVSLRGVVLRMDVSRLPDGPGGPPVKDSIAAAGNPFLTRPSPNQHLVWALGLRNPFRFQVDPVSGSLALGDVGENTREEMDWIDQGGLDLGWPLFEGTFAFGTCPGTRGALTGPIDEYPHTAGSYAVIAGPVYHADPGDSSNFGAGYEGDVFFNDYYQGYLRRLKHTTGWALAPMEPGQPNATDWGLGYDTVSDWAAAPDGSLWYCRQFVNFQASSGQIRRIVHTPSSGVPPLRPQTWFAPPTPNPAAGQVTFRWMLAHAAEAGLEVVDVGGRRVASFIASGAAGPHALTWDVGRAALAPGLYLVRLTTEGRTLVRRLVVTR